MTTTETATDSKIDRFHPSRVSPKLLRGKPLLMIILITISSVTISSPLDI